MAITLDSISTNTSIAPPRVVIYGPMGVGKSTFGAQAPSPIFLPFEDGKGKLSVPSFPLLKTYVEGIEACQALLAGQHQYQTVVVDTLDWLEPHVWAATCAQNRWGSIEEPGYGKGYVEADQQWRTFLQWLDALRMQRGMQIILIAHNEVKEYKDPQHEPYDRHQIKLHKRAAAMVQEWADVVLFENHETLITKDKVAFSKEGHARGFGTGRRILYTEERPAFYAKNRYGLPAEIAIPDSSQSYKVFLDALMAPA